MENKIETPGELMYLDISSMKQASGGGNRHWILLVDRATYFKMSLFVKKKSDQIEVVSKYVSNLKASNNIQVKNIRLNNSGENKALEQECLRLGLGIQFEYTAPGTPQQNGIMERTFPTLMERARAMMSKAGFTGEMRTRMWCEAASTATKLSNIIVKTNETKSAYEKFYNKKPKYAHNLRIFGEIVVAKNISTRLTKLESRGNVCMFVGYADNHAHDVFRLMNLQTNRIVLSRDVQWLNVMWAEHKNIGRNTIIEEDDDDEEENGAEEEVNEGEISEQEENQSVNASSANNDENVSVSDAGRDNEGNEVILRR